MTIAAYLAGCGPPVKNSDSSGSFRSSQASTPGIRWATTPIIAPNVDGSVGGANVPLPPEAHDGVRCITIRTLRPFAFAAFTSTFMSWMMFSA